MDALSPLPALLALLLVVACSWLVVRVMGAPASQGRFESIDGLRGYLAFGVFLHHGSIWYANLRTGAWDEPPSHLYNHLGQSSVALFFMITGFLFFSKLLNGRARPIDWLQLYVSRLLRLMPLYLCALACILVLVGVLSDWILQAPLGSLVSGIVRWLSFGEPDLNGLARTRILVAGVTWSLRYEWIFYLSLPLFALLLGVRLAWGWLLPALLAIAAFLLLQLNAIHLLSFVGGLIAALLARQEAFTHVARTGYASVLVLSCLAVAVLGFPSAFGPEPLLLLSLAFVLIACGNTLFGALVSPASRALGEMAYSIYLLHGLLLFVLFRFVIGAERARAFSPSEHWLSVLAVVPVLLLICQLSWRFIEQPPMRYQAIVTARLRGLFGQGPALDIAGVAAYKEKAGSQ